VSEARRLRVLFLVEDGQHAYSAVAAPLLRRLRDFAGVEVEVGRRLDGQDVVLAATDRLEQAADAEALDRFLEAGGGLVGLHATLAAGGRSHSAGETPVTELLVRPVSGLPLADRLDGELRFRDALPLVEAPAEATLLATVPWHFGDRPLAYSIDQGAGRTVHLGLGHSAETWASPLFAQLVHRCLRHAARLAPAPPLGVGLYGYGAIGREHAEAALAVAGLELRGVCDRSPQRRDQAAGFGVKTYAEANAMLGDPGIDLVVVGVPPAAHAEAVLEALAAGKHVVCEKPFALRAADCDRMIEAAARAQRTLTVYQSRRWDPDFVALREAVGAGEIGEPFYMESFIGGFSHPCSYWHSHEPISGGTIFDWGSHYFDWMLALFPGRVATVSAAAHKRVWHDVTNADQVRVDVSFAGGEQASFLQSDIAAAHKPKWYLLGSGGAVTGDWRLESVKTRAWTGDLIEEPLSPAEAPAVVTVHRPSGGGGVHREVLALAPRAPHGFYRNLADHLLAGEPLAVRAAEARRNIAVMEAAARSIASGRPEAPPE
jgi:scyllo-inositol 2-dehydrogenase (NADP+)